ncbi:MAG: NYN domain-containing protein [Candidatus Thorarchaeota archaeon]
MQKSFLLYWDFENVHLMDEVIIKRFLKRLHYLGDVKRAIAFSDWDKFPRYVAEALHSEDTLLIHVPDNAPQSVDRVMTNYILDELENSQGTHTYVIVSGDSDLWPIVERIKKKKNQAWVIANSINTSQKMLKAGDEYYDIHTFAAWSGPYARGGVVDQEVLKTAAIVTVHEAIEQIERAGKKPGTGLVKAVTLRHDRLFSEQALGFKNWGELMKWAKKLKGIETEGIGDASLVKKPKQIPKRFAELRGLRDKSFQTLFRVVEEMLELGREMGLVWRPTSEENPIMDDLIIVLKKKGVDHLACGYRSVAHLVQAAHMRHIISIYSTDWRNNEFVLAPWYTIDQLRNWVVDLPEDLLGSAERPNDANSLWTIKMRLHRHVLKATTDLLEDSAIRKHYDRIMTINDDLVLPLHLRLHVFGLLRYGFTCEDVVSSLLKYHGSEINREELTCS